VRLDRVVVIPGRAIDLIDGDGCGRERGIGVTNGDLRRFAEDISGLSSSNERCAASMA
jgi:hypothetical protein